MGNGGKTLKSDIILNLRKGPAQVDQVNLVYHENIINEESLPCIPSKPNIWISPVNQRASKPSKPCKPHIMLIEWILILLVNLVNQRFLVS